MKRESPDQIEFKMTNGKFITFEKQQILELEKPTFKNIFKYLEEQVPFEYILIYQVDKKQIISKTNDTLELNKKYELNDARQLVKLYAEKRELQQKQNDMIKLQNEINELKSEIYILKEENIQLKAKFLLLNLRISQKLEDNFSSQQLRNQIEEKENKIKAQSKTTEELIEDNVLKNKELNQLKVLLQENKKQHEQIISDQKKSFELQIQELKTQLQSSKNHLLEEVSIEKIQKENQKQQIELIESKDTISKVQQKLKDYEQFVNNQLQIGKKDQVIELLKNKLEAQQLEKEITIKQLVSENIELKQQLKNLQIPQLIENMQQEIKYLRRQIKPVYHQKTVGLIENINQIYNGVYSKFSHNSDVQKQELLCELFSIKIEDQAQFDQQLYQSQNLSQLSQSISLKSLGMQTIKMTIQPVVDNTFFEGHLFQISTISDLAQNHDPTLNNKTFLMKIIKTLKNSGQLPKQVDESKELTISNFVSKSIYNQFIILLNSKGLNHPQIKFPQQYMIQVQKENDKYFYLIEELVDGEFVQFTSVDIPLKHTLEAQFFNSLVYYSYYKLQTRLMLTNIQGIKGLDQSITLYDSIICSQQGFASNIDLGNEEIIQMKDLIEKDKRFLGNFYHILQVEFTTIG